MEGPGMSLFQGGPSIHINNSAQDRLEEQEELEDLRRRNEELKHELENAFDDFIDDDEASSVNSSRNLDGTQTNGVRQHTRSGLPPSYVESLSHLKEGQPVCESPKLYCETPKNHHGLHGRHEEPITLPYSPYAAGDAQNHYYLQEYRGHVNGINQYDTRQEYMNNEQLKVMYEMRVKECQQLAAQVEKSDTEIESLRARLSAAVHDKDKAERSQQEAHQLLAASKHRCAELEAQLGARAAAGAAGEQERDALRLQLRAAEVALQDAQQRLHTLQVAHSHDTDALFREQQDRHREEVDRLQNDLMKAKHRLDEKENEIKMLEKRCMERDREKEEILIEKGTTINRLASELEAAQSRLVSGEAARLKEKVLQLTSERNAAREQVKELGSKLEVTAHELVLCRNKLSASQKEYENWRTTLNQILMETLPDNPYNIGEPPSPGKLATLKEILSRYKQQSQKLTTLQEELAKREKHHKKQESELRSKLEEQKGLEMQLSSRIAVLQNKLELLDTKPDDELLETYKQQHEQLRHELEEARAELKNLRYKLEEQKSLEMQLNSRIAVLQNKLELLDTKPDDDLMETYKQQHEQLRHELEEARAELKNSELKYTELEMEYEKLKSSKGRASMAREANNDLLRELERCAAQLRDARKENAELKTLYLQVCSTRDAVNREMKDVQAKIQKEKELYKSQEKEYVERIEQEKRQVHKLTSDLNSAKEELDRANKRISELQKEFTDKQKEFSDKLNKYLEDEKNAMRKEIEPCTQCEKQAKHIRYLDEQLSKCNAKLVTQESNETLMKELKGKAEFFQNYIMERFKKLQEQRSVGTNTEESDVPQTKECAEQPNDNDDAFAAKTALMMKEKAIRDQIAEKFTLEMKTIEMNCARRLKEMENEQLTAVNKLKELLERKAREVDTLKEFILTERAKVTQILESKENEISVLIKEHNELSSECQKARENVTDWKLKAERYKEKLSRVSSLEEMLTKEREDWKQRTSSCAKEWQSLKTKSVELQSQLSQLEQKYVKLQMEHQTIQEKYRNAKKTVFTYKDYMSKKDTHINNEINRIQDEYRKIFIKLQNQLNYYVTARMQEEKSKGKSSQSQQHQHFDYSEKMNRLHEEFTRLAKTDFKETEDP